MDQNILSIPYTPLPIVPYNVLEGSRILSYSIQFQLLRKRETGYNILPQHFGEKRAFKGYFIISTRPSFRAISTSPRGVVMRPARVCQLACFVVLPHSVDPSQGEDKSGSCCLQCCQVISLRREIMEFKWF